MAGVRIRVVVVTRGCYLYLFEYSVLIDKGRLAAGTEFISSFSHGTRVEPEQDAEEMARIAIDQSACPKTLGTFDDACV
jgi:hypothetical protein